ncbi:MAG: 6-hydroxymethylpterin diphosphokinase MptE-like protein [Thermoplasmata archaeon]
MNYSEWQPYYKMILNDFHFTESTDRKSAQMLSTILGNNFVKLDLLNRMIQGKEVLIIGDSPYYSLDKKMLDSRLIISADDATKHLMDLDLSPNIVVTDLDADESLLIASSDAGSIMVIHAHGDNIDKLKIAEKIPLRIGTTQAEPLWNVFNFGGFTDGDRAVFLAHHFNAKKIILAGFNFYNPNNRKGKDLEKKMKKLIYSKILINVLMNKYNANIIIL